MALPVRVLFSFVGGSGHLEPLVPVAIAAAASGHEVAFACAPALAGAVADAGFEALPIGSASAAPPPRLPLRPPDRAREERDLRERFVRGAGAYRVPRILELCGAWTPDVLVFDETDFGAGVAADRLGLPFAPVVVIAAGGFLRPDVVGEALDELRAAHGLPPDPALEVAGRHGVLAPLPPSYRDPAFPLPSTACHFRPGRTRPEELPGAPWSATRPGAATVHLTLGTVFNLESGDLLARTVRALRELPIELVVTVGREVDPAELGPQPDHVHVVRYLAHAALLPHCDLVFSHAGSGSVLGSLSHGLPQVLMPIGADQPLNAARCEALGVARVLDPVRASPDEVRAAVSSALHDEALLDRVRALQGEIEALPGPEAAVDALEGIAS